MNREQETAPEPSIYAQLIRLFDEAKRGEESAYVAMNTIRFIGIKAAEFYGHLAADHPELVSNEDLWPVAVNLQELNAKGTLPKYQYEQLSPYLKAKVKNTKKHDELYYLLVDIISFFEGVREVAIHLQNNGLPEDLRDSLADQLNRDDPDSTIRLLPALTESSARQWADQIDSYWSKYGCAFFTSTGQFIEQGSYPRDLFDDEIGKAQAANNRKSIEKLRISSGKTLIGDATMQHRIEDLKANPKPLPLSEKKRVRVNKIRDRLKGLSES